MRRHERLNGSIVTHGITSRKANPTHEISRCIDRRADDHCNTADTTSNNDQSLFPIQRDRPTPHTTVLDEQSHVFARNSSPRTFIETQSKAAEACPTTRYPSHFFENDAMLSDHQEEQLRAANYQGITKLLSHTKEGAPSSSIQVVFSRLSLTGLDCTGRSRSGLVRTPSGDSGSPNAPDTLWSSLWAH